MSGSAWGRTKREREQSIQNGISATLFMLLLILVVFVSDSTTRSLLEDHLLLFFFVGAGIVGLFAMARHSLFKLSMVSLGMVAFFAAAGFIFPPFEFLVPVFGAIGAMGLTYSTGSFLSDFWSDIGYWFGSTG